MKAGFRQAAMSVGLNYQPGFQPILLLKRKISVHQPKIIALD
jgi:hypothetical protein